MCYYNLFCDYISIDINNLLIETSDDCGIGSNFIFNNNWFNSAAIAWHVFPKNSIIDEYSLNNLDPSAVRF